MHRLLKMLQWKLSPVTTYNILLYALKEWDSYVETYFRAVVEQNAAGAPLPGLGHADTVSFWMISFLDNSRFSDERALMIFNVLDTSTLTVESMKSRPCQQVAGLLYVILSYNIQKTHYGMLGFNPSLHNFNNEIKASLDESFATTILNFLITVLHLSSIDELQQPISLFSVLLHCPGVTTSTSSLHESETLNKLWRQLHNPASLNWPTIKNLTITK